MIIPYWKRQARAMTEDVARQMTAPSDTALDLQMDSSVGSELDLGSFSNSREIIGGGDNLTSSVLKRHLQCLYEKRVLSEASNQENIPAVDITRLLHQRTHNLIHRRLEECLHCRPSSHAACQQDSTWGKN